VAGVNLRPRLFTAFLLLPALALADTTTPSDANAKAFPAWAGAARQRVEEAKADAAAIDTVFLGDALTSRWLDPQGGLALWNERFAGHALNFGAPGDGTEHLLWRLNDIDFSPFAPTVRNVVLLIGTNDTTETPDAVAAGIDAVAAKVRPLFPKARLLLVGMPHNARADETTQAANAIERSRADGKATVYVDLPGAMAPDGKSWKGLMPDRLHLSPEGYRIWADLLAAVPAPEAKKEGAEAGAPAPAAK